jgi:hypothetical protein
MVETAASPVRGYLPEGILSAKVDTTQTKDADGYYYKAGDLVEIVADETVGKATTSGKAIGVLVSSIHESSAPEGLDSRHRVSVLTKFRAIVEFTAEGAINAGDAVTTSTTNPGRVKALPPETIDEGGTATHTIDYRDPIGICWKGGADGSKVLVLI